MSGSGSSTMDRAGREAAGSSSLSVLARAGLVARGVNYILVAVLAIQIGRGAGGAEADRQGALGAVAGKPGGEAVLWAIAVGFAELALWRLAEVAYGQAGPDGTKPRKRLLSLGRAVVYGVICASVVAFARDSGGGTAGGQQSSDEQSKGWTARVMDQTGGRWVVLLIGVGVVVAGVVAIVNAVRRRFLRHLNTGQMSESTQRLVESLGVPGRSARGVVICAVGGFLISAAVSYDAGKARGLDDTLRETATTGAGAWPLFAIAVGLVAFGAYSIFEARFRDVQPAKAA